MTALIIVLCVSGILAGLIQYFVDFKGLPVYTPPSNANEALFETVSPKGWSIFVNFIRSHWQFFGYITIGISGAFLVPVIHQLLNLKGIAEYLSCAGNEAIPCVNKTWNLFVIMGYGIISGYSSVRIIRSFGSFIVGNISKSLTEQQLALKKAQDEIAEMKKKLQNIPTSAPTHETVSLEGIINNSEFCDASEDIQINTEELVLDSCKEFPRPWQNKEWRVAGGLKKLLEQANNSAPGRNKSSDGTIGDSGHQARSSDHNPWVLDGTKNRGVVTALDITHDPLGKCDCHVIAKSLQDNKDPRVKYVIWNRRIMNSSPINGAAAWEWRPYTGTNAHDKHIHVSVFCDLEKFDNLAVWDVKFS